jgi:molybdate/tungstate transport system permease protein
MVFGLLGGALLLNLTIPILNLLFQADWPAWAAVLRQPDALAALKTSLAASAITLLVMTFLGVPLGYFLARASLPLKRFWISLIFLPMVVPDLAGGILLLQMLGPNGVIGRPLSAQGIALTNNLAGIVFSELFVASPFVIVSALAAFNSIDAKLELAAATLGDSRWQIFRRISLPLAWPGIAAGITLASIRALGEFGTTLIVAYSPHTLPVYMWVKFESDGMAGALPAAFWLVLLACFAVGGAMLLNRGAWAANPMTALARDMERAA